MDIRSWVILSKWSGALIKVRVFCCDGEIQKELLPLEVLDAMNVLIISVVADLRWLVQKRFVRVGACLR